MEKVGHSKIVRNTKNNLEELDIYIKEKKSERNLRYRLTYHVAPPVGWMNDPNGFSYYKGEYHIFYQFYPYDTIWGPMHWGHYSSSDLVNWKELPTALVPEDEMCFSGSAVVDGDTMILMYTGRLTTETDPFFNESQYLAFSDDGITFTKYEENPVLSYRPDDSADFRDPKAWKYGDYWYVIIGSKTSDDRGRVLLYKSSDMKTWEFLRILAEADKNMGYMWECPDFFELDGKFVLLMSPQGLAPKGDRFKNLYQTGYIIGNFNYDTFEFEQEVEFQEIDFGHDFYASQTTEQAGRRYLVAWFSMWEAPHAEEQDGWVNALTIIRELKLSNDNRILSKPVDAMINLREDIVIFGDFMADKYVEFNNAAEIIIAGDLNQKIELYFEGRDGGDQVWLKWDVDTKKVVLDRNGNVRQVEWVLVDSHSWRIFLDTSSMEVFCGEGEVVFSSRVYPIGGWKLTNLSSQTLSIEAYNLKRSVPV